MQPSSQRRVLLWFLFFLSAAVAITLFFIPAIIIQPFKHQTAFGLALAMALRHRAPWGTLLAASACLAFVIALWGNRKPDEDPRGPVIWRNVIRQNQRRPWWRGAKVWRRLVLCIAMVPVVFSTVMARLNYFEWMFHPVDSACFETEAESKLDKSEMILAVSLGSDARAYPILQMAYHHVLNDVVNGVPIAVTY
jgi:hypothetical protein